MNNNSENKEERPPCFGDLDTVFPMGPDGLRKTPDSCMDNCDLKTQCLKTAMTSGPKGYKARESYVDRAYDSGMISFFERWSRKKYLNQRAKQKKK